MLGGTLGTLAQRLGLRESVSPTPGIFVLDPGFGEAFGHHPALNRMIIAYCEEHGLPTRVFANKRCPPTVLNELGATPIFNISIYDPMPATWQQTLRKLSLSNRESAVNLKQSLGRSISGNIVVLHTIGHWNFRGIYDWARRLTNRRDDLTFKLLFRFEHTFSAVPRDVDSEIEGVLRDFYKKTISAWQKLSFRVEFFVDSVVLEQEYKSICPADYKILPVQVEFPDDASRVQPPSRYDHDPVFLFVGNAREEKGIGLLVEAIDYYLAHGQKGRFVVQSLDLAPPDIARNVSAKGIIEILDRPFVGQSYYDFIRSGDVVLIAYDPKRYRYRTSHILIEAMGLGRPVITTSGSWMDAELGRLGRSSSILIQDYTGEGLGKAMVEFAQRRRELSEQARAIAADVRDRHNHHAFLNAFLGLG